MEEMLRRTPSGLETPAYNVLCRRPQWEVRQYADFAVCSTDPGREVAPDGLELRAPKMSGAGAFQALAGYIFGSNERGEKMAMTTPVLSRAEGVGRKMSFVLPSRYWAGDPDADADARVGDGPDAERSQPPAPLEASGVVIESSGGGFLASGALLGVVWFDGLAGNAEVERQRRLLEAMVDADPQYELLVGAEPTLLQYNDPFTLPWKRRNELAIPVSEASSTTA